MSMADRVVLLREGRVEQDAPPDLLYAKPATVFAARFIGTPPMNIVTLAAIRPDADAGTLVGVRPEDIALGAAGVPARDYSSA